jgi:ABC-type multidrug transport system fused ATPase/permease subunit
MILKRLFFAHRRSILLTYFLTISGNMFELLYPFATGIAIDGLIKKNYEGLTLFTCIWLAQLITSVSRHIYDTRTFTSIYRDLATLVVLQQNKQGVSTSRIIARSALSREFVDFFERDIPQIFKALFGFLGALVMLFIYDIQIGCYCLTLFIPLSIINYKYVKTSIFLNRELNDRLEREVDILSNCQSEEVRGHYQSLVKWQIYLSNAEAANYGLMELFSIALSVFVIIRTIQLPEIQVGKIYAILQYLWNFLASLQNVPALVQQFSRLKDIGDRIQLTSKELFTATENVKDLE